MYGRDMEPYRALALDLWHHGWLPGSGGIVNTYWSPRYSGWAGAQGFTEGGKRLLFIAGFIVLNSTTLLWVLAVFILMILRSVPKEIKLLIVGWFLVTWLSVLWFPSPNPFRYGMALDNVACIAVAMVYQTLYLPKKVERGTV